MADEPEDELELGVFIPMDKFMEVLDLMMAVCTILHDALGEAEEVAALEAHPILSLVPKKKPDSEPTH